MLQEDLSQLEVCEGLIMGFKLCKVVGATYPALAVDPDAKQPIAGLLTKNLTKTMVKKLDIFEGQNYARGPVEVTVSNERCPRTAEAYLPKNLTKLYGKWNFEHWYKNHSLKFLVSLHDN